MKRAIQTLFFISLIFANAVAAQSIDQAPTPFAPYLQDNFKDYLSETTEWLSENRVFRGADQAQELVFNAPFELVPFDSNGQAILLVHGLSDSPYSFQDVARRLADKGFRVRVILLPGHGAKPADLLLLVIEDWVSIVRHHTQLLLRQSESVWVGGFSTGANLAMIEAIDNPEVRGAVLFSPAIVSRKPLDFLAPWAKHLKKWADVDPEESLTRFDSLTMNGAALYYESKRMLQSRLKTHSFDRPVFMTLSEADSVVDSKAVYGYFKERFTDPSSRLLWFGDREGTDPRVTSYAMNLPEKRISTGSHMFALYPPDNPLYGEKGSFRMCNNGQSEHAEQRCREGAEVWYARFDYVEKNKIHARLTWNPYFDQTMDALVKLISDAKS